MSLLNFIFYVLSLLPNLYVAFICAAFIGERESKSIKNICHSVKLKHSIFLFLSCLSYSIIALPFSFTFPFELNDSLYGSEIIVTFLSFYLVSKHKLNILWQHILELLFVLISIIHHNQNWYEYPNESFVILLISIAYWIVLRAIPFVISCIRVKKANLNLSYSEFLFLVDNTVISYTPIYVSILSIENKRLFFNTVNEILSSETETIKKHINKKIDEYISDADDFDLLLRTNSPVTSTYRIISEICYKVCISGEYHYMPGELTYTGKGYFNLYIKMLDKLISQRKLYDSEKNEKILKLSSIICKTHPSK